MPSGSLILFPVDAEASCPRERVVGVLAQVGMIGDALAGAADAFLVGDRFLQLITFMGCSPHIQLEPVASEGGDFCHVVLHVHNRPRLLAGINTRPPRCPGCGKIMDIEVSDLDRDDPSRPVVCNRCGTSHALADLKWRRDAGFARLFLEIRSVFPGEAVPVEALFRALAETTDCNWDYIYLTFPSGGQFQPLGQQNVDRDREMVG